MKSKKQSSKNTFIKGEAVGLLIGASVMMLCAMLIAYFVQQEILPVTSVGVISFIILYVSSFFGNMSAVKIAKANTLVNGLIYAGLYMLIMLILNVTIFNAPTSNLFVSLISVALGSITVCVNTLIPKKNRGYKKLRHS